MISVPWLFYIPYYSTSLSRMFTAVPFVRTLKNPHSFALTSRFSEACMTADANVPFFRSLTSHSANLFKTFGYSYVQREAFILVRLQTLQIDESNARCTD